MTFLEYQKLLPCLSAISSPLYGHLTAAAALIYTPVNDSARARGTREAAHIDNQVADAHTKTLGENDVKFKESNAKRGDRCMKCSQIDHCFKLECKN